MWLTPGALADCIETFCRVADTQGVQDDGSSSISRAFDDALLTMEWSLGSPFPANSDCTKYITSIMTGCGGNNPDNPINLNHEGRLDAGEVSYSVKPRRERYFAGVCGFHFYQLEEWWAWTSFKPYGQFYHVQITGMKDAQRNIFYKDTRLQEAGNETNRYSLEGLLYDFLVITPETQRGDYIRFNLGS